MRELAHLVASLLIAAAMGCSSDEGSAADAAQPDAFGSSDGDGGVDGGGGNGTPFSKITCSGGADAGANAPDAMPGSPDAMPASDTDAGPPLGLDDPCCDPEGDCGGDFACVEGPSASAHHCRPLCDLQDKLCPLGGVCANFGGQGICVVAGGEGDSCAPELCEAATICVGDSADDAVCRRRCETQEECAEGTTCTTLTGIESKACL